MTYYEIFLYFQKICNPHKLPFWTSSRTANQKSRLSLIRFGAIFKNVYTIRPCAQLWLGPEFSKDRKWEDRVHLKRTC